MRAFTTRPLHLALAVSGCVSGCFVDVGAGPIDASADATSGGAAATTAAPTTGTGSTVASLTVASSTATSTTDTGTTADDTTGTLDASSTGTTEAADRCGDAKVDPGEDCDNGDGNNGQGGSVCKADCTINVCGDAYVAADEACDDGNTAPGDGCSATCTAEVCGDGVLLGVEGCDDGNLDAGDGCSPTCMLEVCGNAILDPGEACDDGNLDVLDTCGVSCERLRFHVFVTSAKYTADLGGTAGADAACNQLAAAAKLPGAGRFVAWLSGTQPADAATTRLFHSPLPYIMPNNAKVVDHWTDLTDASLDNAIVRTETSEAVVAAPINCNDPATPDALVWTNSTPMGAASTGACADWSTTDPMLSGTVGLVGRKDNLWTSGCLRPCDVAARLYCVEQP